MDGKKMARYNFMDENNRKYVCMCFKYRGTKNYLIISIFSVIAQ